MFPDKDAARRRIESVVWPDGPVCRRDHRRGPLDSVLNSANAAT